MKKKIDKKFLIYLNASTKPKYTVLFKSYYQHIHILLSSKLTHTTFSFGGRYCLEFRVLYFNFNLIVISDSDTPKVKR